jgi:hypothetical protein
MHNNVILLLHSILSCYSNYDNLRFVLNFQSEFWIIYVHWEMKFENPWQRTGIYTSNIISMFAQASRSFWVHDRLFIDNGDVNHGGRLTLGGGRLTLGKRTRIAREAKTFRSLSFNPTRDANLSIYSFCLQIKDSIFSRLHIFKLVSVCRYMWMNINKSNSQKNIQVTCFRA